MKKTRIFERRYNWDVIEGSHGHEHCSINKEDKISLELSDACISLPATDNPTTRTIDSQNFLWYDKGIFYIEVSTGLGIRDDYKRIVTIESMPESAQLPSGLLKLLDKNSFIKSK